MVGVRISVAEAVFCRHQGELEECTDSEVTQMLNLQRQAPSSNQRAGTLVTLEETPDERGFHTLILNPKSLNTESIVGRLRQPWIWAMTGASFVLLLILGFSLRFAIITVLGGLVLSAFSDVGLVAYTILAAIVGYWQLRGRHYN